MSAGIKHFTVPVEGLGTFTFRKRSIKDQLRIEAKAVEFLGGPTLDPGLRNVAMAVATLEVLTVAAPDGWDLDAIDPLETGQTDPMFKAHRELRDAEDRFRQRAKAERTGLGAPAQQDDGLRVPPAIPARAD